MAKQNEDWFIGIFAKYSTSLRRYIRRYSVSEDTAADVAQEAFMRMYVASRADSVKHPRAYLFQVARNLVLNHIRDKVRARTDTVGDFDDLGVYGNFPCLEADSISREEYELLLSAIKQLPPQCQRVFILRKVYQYSYREIVDELGIALSTVEKHVALGVKICNRHFAKSRETAQPEAADNNVVRIRKQTRG